MLRVTDHIRNHLLGSRLPAEVPPMPSLESLRDSERVGEFDLLCSNRMVMGAFRYGLLGAANKPTYDRVGAIINRAREYQETGNTELLVDIANICKLEFAEGVHPLKHFAARDGGQHVTIMAHS